MAPSEVIRSYIERRDHRLMRKVHRWRAPRWIRLWMIYSTRAGDGWLWYLLGIILLAFGGSDGRQAAGSAAAAAGMGIILFRLLKRLSGRKRPCVLERHCWAVILPPDQFSFPSGHTITAFAVAISVGLRYPDLMAFLIFCALSIAASRIILGMHFLSDVVAGCLMGGALAYASFFLFH